MATIPARKPYYITKYNTYMRVELAIVVASVTKATYSLIATSFSPSQAEDLSINIAPYLTDFFEHKIQDSVPTGIELAEGEDLISFTASVYDSVGTSIGFYSDNAMDGWVEPATAQAMYVEHATVKTFNAAEDYQFITANLRFIDTVRYTDNLGNVVNLTHSEASGIYVFPVVPPAFKNTDIKTIKIEILDGTTVYGTVNYIQQCPYDGVTSLGFINHFGAWELFNTMGIHETTYVGTGEDYVQASTGNKKQYGNNVYQEQTHDTGWVDNNFRRVVQQFLASEFIVLYTGSPYDYPIVMSNKVMPRPHPIKDKMINWRFLFRNATTLIPTV